MYVAVLAKAGRCREPNQELKRTWGTMLGACPACLLRCTLSEASFYMQCVHSCLPGRSAPMVSSQYV